MHTILYNTIDWHHTFCSGGMSYGLYCLLLHTFICCHNKYNNVCHISPPGPHCFKCSMAGCINECNCLVCSFNADCKRKTTWVSKCFAVDSAKVVSYGKFIQGQKVFILIRVTNDMLSSSQRNSGDHCFVLISLQHYFYLYICFFKPFNSQKWLT